MSDLTSWTRRRKLIAERTLYFSEPDSFNDPWDLELSRHPELRNKLRKEVRMFCLSGERRDDALMFAHYGDSHRGIRLRFAIDQDHPLEELSPLAKGEFVTYADDLEENKNNPTLRALYTKQPCWSYEAEYRILVAEIQSITYGTYELREVAFGYRLLPDFESVVRKWVEEGEHKQVKFVRARLATDRIGFDYEPT